MALKGHVPWNKGKKCPQLTGSNNPMFGKKRPDLVERNKSVSQKESIINYNKNRVLSSETKIKMSVSNRTARLKEKNWQLEKNPSWNGGNSKIRKTLSAIKYYQWRRTVLERDGYKCLMCLHRVDLEVHHIIMISEDPSKAFDVDNGITLCKACHFYTHHPKQRHKDRRLENIMDIFTELMKYGS